MSRQICCLRRENRYSRRKEEGKNKKRKCKIKRAEKKIKEKKCRREKNGMERIDKEERERERQREGEVTCKKKGKLMKERMT